MTHPQSQQWRLEGRLRVRDAEGLASGNRLADDLDRVNAECQRLREDNHQIRRSLAQAEDDRRVLVKQFEDFAGYVVTCQRENQHEWMSGLIERLNELPDSVRGGVSFEHEPRFDGIRLIRPNDKSGALGRAGQP